MIEGYTLICNALLNIFNHTVWMYLQDGWELYGNPFAVEEHPHGEPLIYYYQAMIKKAENDTSM